MGGLLSYTRLRQRTGAKSGTKGAEPLAAYTGQMPTDPLSTNHLPMSDDFDRHSYENVFSRLAPLNVTYPIPWGEYVGAWIALSYRFYSCAEYSDSFTESLQTHGGTAQALERYRQERDLYNFFVSGLSAIESFYYGLFAIASMLDSNNFPIQTAAAKKSITPGRVVEKFLARFEDENVTITMQDLLNDQKYREWNDRRNILAHRITPGRRMSITVTMGTDDSDYGPLRWGEIYLDERTTPSRRRWLAETLRHLLSAADTFTATRF